MCTCNSQHGYSEIFYFINFFIINRNQKNRTLILFKNEKSEIANSMKKTEINEACEIFGARLKRVRLNKNLTQIELAKLAQISRGKIIEAEKGNASIETLVSILSALNPGHWFELLLLEETDSLKRNDKKDDKERQRASGIDKRLFEIETPKLSRQDDYLNNQIELLNSFGRKITAEQVLTSTEWILKMSDEKFWNMSPDETSKLLHIESHNYHHITELIRRKAIMEIGDNTLDRIGLLICIWKSIQLIAPTDRLSLKLFNEPINNAPFEGKSIKQYLLDADDQSAFLNTFSFLQKLF
jgi:putative transcriptional regulator